MTNNDVARMTKSTEASVKMQLSGIRMKYDVANREDPVGAVEGPTAAGRHCEGINIALQMIQKYRG